ncbi:unnamed protein product [Heterobilharzia americana]|nr:unnamed protein product [Heterobilharzia americana]
MVQRLGALRKGFPINYRHSPTTAYAGSLLKIRWIARKNKQQGTVAGWQRTNQEPITQEVCSGRKWRWIGHTLRRPTGDIMRQASHLSGIPMGSDELDVRGEGDVEEMVRGGNGSLWADVEPGSKDFREQISLETCY